MTQTFGAAAGVADGAARAATTGTAIGLLTLATLRTPPAGTTATDAGITASRCGAAAAAPAEGSPIPTASRIAAKCAALAAAASFAACDAAALAAAAAATFCATALPPRAGAGAAPAPVVRGGAAYA